MIFEIPIEPSSENFRITAPLDGQTYVLDIDWSARGGAWYLSLYLQTDTEPTPIIQGVRISAGYPLTMGVVVVGRPAGELFALDSNGQGDPGREDLGTRVKLYYFDADELGL